MRNLVSRLLVASALAVTATVTAGGCADPSVVTANPSVDAGETPIDASTDPGADAGADASRADPVDAGDAGIVVDPIDGPPTRVACTNGFGAGLSATYGRLDGFLVSIVPVSTHRCNGDSGHLHLQVRMNGGIYDVAANMDVLSAEKTAPMPDGPWSEGWHSGVTFDYANTLDVHAADFTQLAPADLEAHLTEELKSANHLSVFATGYGPDGVHNVHRRTGSGSNDGAIVLNPLSPTPRILMFRFTTDSF
jgi:hypothetical protein